MRRRRRSRTERTIEVIEAFARRIEKMWGPDDDAVERGLIIAATALTKYAAVRPRYDGATKEKTA